MPGYIEKRGNNSYRLVVSAGFGPGGKRKKHTKTIKVDGRTEAAKQRAAEKELAKFVAKIEGNNFVEPVNITLKCFVEKWIEDYAKPNLAPKTIYNYERLLDSRIIPVLGHLKLSQLKPIHFIEFYKMLQEKGIRNDGKGDKLSNSTVMHYHRLLRNMLNSAVKWGLITSNPVNNVDPPKVKKKEASFYNEEEIKNLIKALEDEETKYKAAIMITISGGLRLGELVGLTWDNIDFDDNTINIEQSNQYLPGSGTFTKDPKNNSSKRIISIPGTIMGIISQHKSEEELKEKQCGDKWEGSGFVFTQWNGAPMHPDTPSKWFAKLIKRKGLKKITFHQLRHTSATMLINAGLNIRALSARLGHSNTSTTLNIYSHALRSADKAAANKIEEVMFNNNVE